MHKTFAWGSSTATDLRHDRLKVVTSRPGLENAAGFPLQSLKEQYNPLSLPPFSSMSSYWPTTSAIIPYPSLAPQHNTQAQDEMATHRPGFVTVRLIKRLAGTQWS